MTEYGLYDTIPAAEEQRIKTLLYNNFSITIDLNFEDQIGNDYCSLEAEIENDANNEYIIKSFKVTLRDERFKNQNYYLELKFYDLETGDITDTHTYDTLKTQEYFLTNGENEITLNENTPCYLLKDFRLIIKGTPCDRFKRIFAPCIEGD